MSYQDRLRVLHCTKELGRVSESQLRGLLRFLDEIVVPAGTNLAFEGRLCHQFFIVAGGELETCRQASRGKLGVGDTVGWKAMHEQGWNEATVMATAATRLLVMGHDQFRAVRALVTESS